MIRGNLTKIQRQKIVALVTIEVHARDVIEKMIKSGCGDVTAFEWLSQLRLYWDKVCVIKIPHVLCVQGQLLTRTNSYKFLRTVTEKTK